MTKIVNEDSFTIGRSVDCAISLTEDSISRVHLTVYRRQNQIWIEDKGSSNGTFVNGVKMAQNTLVNVIPADKIRIGKSDYVVSINLELKESELPNVLKAENSEFMRSPLVAEKMVERKIDKTDIEFQIDQVALDKKTEALKETAAEEKKESDVLKAPQAPKGTLEKKSADLFSPKVDPKLKQSQAANPAQNQRPVGRLEVPNSADAVPKSNEENKPLSEAAAFEVEKALHAAHKKAAQIIYDGEMKAEKRVQAIYIQAQERQTEADRYFQQKISAAHKEADEVIRQFQTQGQELIVQARHMAQELRDEVDLYVDNMREKTRREVDHIIGEARQEAEIVKQEAFEKALTKAEIEAADILSSAKAEAEDLVGFAKMQSEEMLGKAKKAIEDDLKDLREQIDTKQKRVQILRKEEEELEIKAQGEREEHETRIAALLQKFNSLQDEMTVAQKDLSSIRSQETGALEETKRQEGIQEELKKQNQSLLQERSNLESKLKEMQEQVGRFSLDIQSSAEKRKHLEQDLNQQKAQLRERLEKERQQIIKESEERLNESQLEMGKRLQKLERELFDEILNRKEKLVKEIIVIVETRIAKVLEPAKWDQVSSVIFDGIQAVIEGKAVSFTGVGTNVPKQSQSLQRKRKKENLRWMAGGLACGLALTFGALRVQTIMNQDKNPMRTIASEEARRRQEDLEKRKFNPVQSPDLKDSYTDAVIYTQNFVDAYQETEFQKKLYKAASAYLLKTWRVDEDKSIQVLSMASALVKELNEKKQTIHPDFVKDGIQKMHGLEKQTTERMKNVLGSEVRLESFRRFERKFYETEVLKR